MSARHLRNVPVHLDPDDHGYPAPRPDPGEVVVELDPSAARRCCERDTDGDGNCPTHEAPGVLRRARAIRRAW